jgi:phage terminase small subunit
MPGNAASGGRNAKTIKELKAQGTFDTSRHSGIKNMRYVHGRPTAPPELTGEALRQFNLMADRAEQAGSASPIDDAALAQYAMLWVETDEAAKKLIPLQRNINKLIAASNKLDGQDLVEAMRQIAALESVHLRYVGQVRQGRMALRQYLVEFGMTPSARGRVKMPESEGGQTGGKLSLFRGGKK